MRIETQRLIITRFTMDMAQAVHLNSLDKVNRRYVPDEVFETLEEAADTVSFLMGVYENGGSPLVYPVLLKDATYIGYATEAAKAFLPVIMPKLGIKRMRGICIADNKASRKVMERCGFVKKSEGPGPYRGNTRNICRYHYTIG